VNTKPKADSMSATDIATLASALRPVRLSPAERKTSFERILARIHAPPPLDTVTIRGDEIPWERESPFRERKLLLRDFARNEQTYLVRLAPGHASRPHSHEVQEVVWVIEGEIQMGEHVFRAGDLHVAAQGSYHEEFKTVTGALVLIRGHIPPDVPRPKVVDPT
jgi:mannose-6-phosphate isomerase-like protein (cupin superfamily)